MPEIDPAEARRQDFIEKAYRIYETEHGPIRNSQEMRELRAGWEWAEADRSKREPGYEPHEPPDYNRHIHEDEKARRAELAQGKDRESEPEPGRKKLEFFEDRNPARDPDHDIER